MHKTANVLNKMPKALQATAKCDRYQIALAETRDAAINAFDHFLEKYGAKVEAACSCLSMDRDALPAFYDFPAEHWGHLRTTNPIESTFSTIRLRHRRTKGSGSRKASLAMMFKFAQSASRRWRRLNGHHHLVDERRVAIALVATLQRVVDRDHDLRVTELLGTDHVVLGQPVAHGAPRPERLPFGEIAFRRRESTRPANARDVLVDELTGTADAPGDFRGRDEIAAIDAPHVDTDPGLPHVADGTQDGVLQGRGDAGKLHGDAAVHHAQGGVVTSCLEQGVLDLGGQFARPAEDQREVVFANTRAGRVHGASFSSSLGPDSSRCG